MAAQWSVPTVGWYRLNVAAQARHSTQRRTMRATGPFLALCLAVTSCDIACSAPPLTLGQAADLLAASRPLSGVETMTYTTPRGCFVLEPDEKLDRRGLDRDPQFTENATLKSLVDLEQRLDLLDFEFSPSPLNSPSPPEGCDRPWAAYHRVTSGLPRSEARLIAWRSFMSDKAMAAGLQPGHTFVSRRRELIAVGRIVMKDPQTAVVDYTWHLMPSYETEHIGFAPSEPVRTTATFVRSGKTWSLIQ
jgi:hypothetical protein